MARRSRQAKKARAKKSAGKFAYDSVDTTGKKRRVVSTMTQSEDDVLNTFKRRRMISSSRDLQRNFSAAGWAIRKHLDYVSTFAFQVKTADLAFNKRAEQLFAWWSLPKNCDISGRHSLERFIRIGEQARAIDGDVLVIMTKEGYLQAVEADRISTPTGNNTKTADGGAIINGVKVDSNGRALEYGVSKRSPGGSSLTFDKWVSADFAHLLGYFDRYDQVRGITRMAAAINSFQDLYEGISYALAKAKVAQLFGLITYRADNGPLGAYSQNEDTDSTEYEINFGKGPFHLDLDGGDKAEILESKTPSAEFQQFTQTMIALAIKSLDIPYSFFDESFTNYSGARQALLQYEQSVKAKRKGVVELLNRITAWKLTQWIASGLLKMPAGMRLSDTPWEWIPNGIPWIDPQKEMVASALAINANVKSRQMICKINGDDFHDVADQLAAEKEYLESKGLSAETNVLVGAAPVENTNVED